MVPCCAVFPSKNESPFPWKDPLNRPPLEDKNTHIPILEKMGIPYIADIHTHFFPEVVMKLIWKWFDKVNWEITCKGNDDKRVEVLNKNKVKYYTTLNYAHKKNMAESLNLWVYQNYKMLKGAIPFGTFYPENKVLDYVKRSYEEYGFKGYKLHLEVGKFDINESILSPVFHYIENNKIPIVIHTGNAPLSGDYTGINFFSKFIRKYPQLYAIIAHMGAGEVEEYSTLLGEYSNLRMDTTMVFVDFYATGENLDPFISILSEYPDQILFGSDFPNIPYNYSHPVEKLLNSGLDEDILRKVFYKNFHSLPGLDIEFSS